jgi:ABC-type proline/glycine betaine transport system permease subunit
MLTSQTKTVVVAAMVAAHGLGRHLQPHYCNHLLQQKRVHVSPGAGGVVVAAPAKSAHRPSQ